MVLNEDKNRHGSAGGTLMMINQGQGQIICRWHPNDDRPGAGASGVRASFQQARVRTQAFLGLGGAWEPINKTS